MDECDCNFPSCMECFERSFKAMEEYCGVDKEMCYEGLAIISSEYAEEQSLEDCDPKVLEDIIKNPNEW